MRNSAALFLIFLLVICQTAFSATGAVPEKQIDVRWSQLEAFLKKGDFLRQGKAMLALRSGAIVEGQIQGMHSDELVLQVSKSSEKKAYPKGRLSLPRDSVLTIRLTRNKSAKGRVIGTIAGIVGGSAIAGAVALSQPDDGSAGDAARVGVLGLWVGTGVAGYYLGRSMDRETTLIRVLPN